MTNKHENDDLARLIQHLTDLEENGGTVMYQLEENQTDGSTVPFTRIFRTNADMLPSAEDRVLLGALYRLTILDERHEHFEIEATVSLHELAEEMGIQLDKHSVTEWDQALTRFMLISIADVYPTRTSRNHVIEGVRLSWQDNDGAIDCTLSFRWSPQGVYGSKELR